MLWRLYPVKCNGCFSKTEQTQINYRTKNITMNRVTCHKCINVKREQIFFLAVRGGGVDWKGGKLAKTVELATHINFSRKKWVFGISKLHYYLAKMTKVMRGNPEKQKREDFAK